MKSISLFLILLLPAAFAQAQTDSKKEQDRKAITAMEGCYNVSFDFAETFSPDTAYKYHDRYHASATEYVFVLTNEPDFIQIQHLLIINDSTIIKHWRQDWVYEETELLSYEGDRNWKTISFAPREVEGTWTQKVYQVDDSPRYESKGTWVHVDGKHYWEGTGNAPLPRREYTKRNDYNLVVRHSRIELTENGWFLEQDNEKVLRSDEGNKLICREKGMEKFTKGDYNCQPAITWWEENKEYWAEVRKAWSEVYAENPRLKFQKKVDNKMLWQQLYAIGGEATEGGETADLKDKVKAVILKYLEA